jgi:hypothetical protein
MNVIANCTQRCSGAVVEYLIPNLKVEGSRPPCAQILFRYTAGKIPVAQKTKQKIQAHMPKTFLLYVRNESAAPGLGSGKSRQAL